MSRRFFASQRRPMATTSPPPPASSPTFRAVPTFSAVPPISGTDSPSLNRSDSQRISSLFSDNFRADVVARRYRLDRLPSSDWLLVYNYRLGSFLFSIGRYALALLFLIIAISVDDFVRVGHGKFTIRTLQLKHSEVITFGYFGKFICAIAMLVFCSLLRLRMLFLLRVYVHRTEPNRICAKVGKGLFSAKLVELDRSSIRVVPAWLRVDAGPIEPGWGALRAFFRRIFNFLWYGDVQFGHHGARIMHSEGFRTNMLRNWTLNERDVVPKRELAQLDTNLEGANAGWRRNLRWWQRIFHLFR